MASLPTLLQALLPSEPIGRANWDLLQNPHLRRRRLRTRAASHYTVNKKLSLEWCYLIADSLGGPTEPANLVAASYGANTHMLAIESCLQSRTDVEVEVTAFCSRENCAEYILYDITNSRGQALAIGIDATNDQFPPSAFEAVRAEVTGHIGSSR